jgi:hypothetical protein
MLRIPIDVNRREEPLAIAIKPGAVPEENLRVGERVVLYEPGFECEAILRHGTTWKWVADIIEETICDVPYNPE